MSNMKCYKVNAIYYIYAENEDVAECIVNDCIAKNEYYSYHEIKENKPEKLYIVTNAISGGEYTPTLCSSFDEAKDWLIECTANNIRSWMGGKYKILFNMSNIDVIEWGEKNLPDFEFSEKGSKIYYGDDDYNIMNIYEVPN